MKFLPELQRLLSIDLLKNESYAVSKGPEGKVFLVFDCNGVQNLFFYYRKRLLNIIHGIAYDLSELWHELPFGALTIL